MLLKEWIKLTGFKSSHVAEKTKIEVCRFSGITTGRIEPRLMEVSDIFDFTEGAVDWTDHLAAVKLWRAKNAK